MKRIVSVLLALITVLSLMTPFMSVSATLDSSVVSRKKESTFYGNEVMQNVLKNREENVWAEALAQEQIEKAKPWMELSYDELWDMMVSYTVKRVYATTMEPGTCPDCGESVPTRAWEAKMDVKWKVACPHCGGLFPKNDFEAYYNSGLDEHGVFSYDLADDSLLVNTEDGSKNYVDDGKGCKIDGMNYYFIGNYIYKEWWLDFYLPGIINLSNAYIVTGDKEYSRRAAIMLDRLADLYPEFNFRKQGIVYENQAPSDGAIGYWDVTNDSVVKLSIAYDMIFEALENDTALVDFLKSKAETYKLDNKKESISDIRENIEVRIFLHILEKPAKVYRNFPMQETCMGTLKAVLDWDYFTSEEVDSGEYDGLTKKKDYTWNDGIRETLTYIFKEALVCDGLSESKGLSGYTTVTTNSAWMFLMRVSEKDPSILVDVIRDNPEFLNGIKIFINLWANELYFPKNGDAGNTMLLYDGNTVMLYADETINYPSIIKMFCDIYDITGDISFLQLASRCAENTFGNGFSKYLPRNIFVKDAKALSERYNNALLAAPNEIVQESVDYKEQHLASIVTGEGENKRYIMLDYDGGGEHGHHDAMNIYIFGKEVSFLNDFGYPPIATDGGWSSKYVYWYRHPLAHNTVTVGGNDDEQVKKINKNSTINQYGEITLWGIGDVFKAMGSTSDGYRSNQYDRFLSMIDIDNEDSYILDIFRLSGEGTHAKSIHSSMGSLNVSGLTFTEGGTLPDKSALIDNLSTATDVNGFSADFLLENDYDNGRSSKTGLKYTDLSKNLTSVIKGDATAFVYGNGGASLPVEIDVPTILTVNENGGFTNFVGVFEPYAKTNGSKVESINRLDLTDLNGTAATDRDVAVSVILKNGYSDAVIFVDKTKYNETETKNGVKLDSLGIETDAESVFVRKDADGSIKYISFAGGTYVKINDKSVTVSGKADFLELKIKGEEAMIKNSGVAKESVTLVGYTLVDSLPETAPETIPETTPETELEDNGEESDSGLILWIIIAAVVLLAVLGTVFFLAKKKK